MEVSSQEFARAVRNIAGTVCLVSVGGEGTRTGLTVTSVVALTVDPPTLGVAVNKTASAHSRILAERCFSVNILREEHDEIANVFAGRKDFAGEDRFVHGQWNVALTGTSMLADAVASFECVLGREFDLGTHTLFVGEVRGLNCSGVVPPLVYFDGRFRSLSPVCT